MTDQSKEKVCESEKWHNRTFHWFFLRGFGQSIPASITMSTPFIGYLILYHEEIQRFLGGMGGFLDQQVTENCCGPWLSFPMRLHILYCGLLLLGMGTIVYRLFAPEVVKSWKNISDYTANTVDHLTARNLRMMYDTIRAHRTDLTQRLISRAPWLDLETSLKRASDDFKNGDGQIRIDVLQSYYDTLNRQTNRTAVYLSTLAYLLGFLLLAIPGAEFTLRVLCVIIKRL